MGLSYTLHNLDVVQGRATGSAALPIRGVGTLALDTPSAAIQGPALLRVTADENVVLDARETLADLNTVTAQFRLVAGETLEIPIAARQIYLQAAAASFQVIVDTGSPGAVIDIVPTLDTAAFAAGDVAFDFQPLAGALFGAGRTGLLQSIVVKDKADQKPTLTFVFADQSGVILGTANAAPSMSDADSFKSLGHQAVAAADWLDLGTSALATVKNIGLMLEAASGTTVYVAALITPGGTAGTFGANDLECSFGILKG